MASRGPISKACEFPDVVRRRPIWADTDQVSEHRQEAAILLVEQAMSEPRLGSMGCGSVATYSVGAPGKESPNEDALAVLPVGQDAAVLVVADGMGGQSAGERAARIAVEALADAVSGLPPEGSLRTAILDGLEAANQRVMELGTGSATTISLVEVSEGTCRPYHVGDSMILLTGGRGVVRLQAIAHSPVGYGIEAGLLDEDASMAHEDRHVVSNFVGSPEMRIEIGPPVKLRPLDTLVLASDGLSDNLTPTEIVDRIRKGPLLRAARRLAKDTRERMHSSDESVPGKPDDLSFVLFRPTRR